MVDSYRVFHPKPRQYTFFSAAHGTFSKIDSILGHKLSLKKIEISPCIISDHTRIKVDLNNKRNPRKYSNTWRLNNTLLKKTMVTEEVKKFLESSENESVGHSKGCAKGKVYSYKCLH
jgi:hypothetical protein